MVPGIGLAHWDEQAAIGRLAESGKSESEADPCSYNTVFQAVYKEMRAYGSRLMQSTVDAN